MPQQRPPLIALGPDPNPRLSAAITAGGGVTGELTHARGLIWTGDPDGFPDPLPPTIEWVQLNYAGVEAWFAEGIIQRYPDIVFTSSSSAFGATVAEHALALLLAGVRHLKAQAAARDWRHDEFAPHVGSLSGAPVALIGAGSIGRALIPALAALRDSGIDSEPLADLARYAVDRLS